jgi:hypothetical protein
MPGADLGPYRRSGVNIPYEQCPLEDRVGSSAAEVENVLQAGKHNAVKRLIILSSRRKDGHLGRECLLHFLTSTFQTRQV